MAAKPKRSRTVRRNQVRAADKLSKQRLALFALEPGGSAQHPVEVPSASVVESRAESFPCPLCEGAQHVVDHQVRTVDGHRLRELTVRCRQCSTERSIWARLTSTAPN